MKLLVVCQYYPPEPFRIGDICEALVELGHSVTVVTGTPNYPEGEIYPGYKGNEHREETVNGVRIHRCQIHPRKKGILHRFWNYYSFVFASGQYLKRLDEDFDVVFINQLSPVMMAEGALNWARKNGKKAVLYCLDLWPESLLIGGVRADSWIYRWFLCISKNIYCRCNKILVPSHAFEEYLQEKFAIATNKLLYLPQYAEKLFDTVPIVSAHSAPYHILFAGNIGELQAVETIIEAGRMLCKDDRIQFHIVGDGIRLESCKALAKDLSNIKFYGRRNLEEMPMFYEMADIGLVTLKDSASVSNTLLPGKLQSYMAAGRAVVGAATGEMARVLADANCGVCVGCEDAIALAQQLQYLAEHPEIIWEYGLNARKHYQSYFRKEMFIAKLTAVLEENTDEHE